MKRFRQNEEISSSRRDLVPATTPIVMQFVVCGQGPAYLFHVPARELTFFGAGVDDHSSTATVVDKARAGWAGGDLYPGHNCQNAQI